MLSLPRPRHELEQPRRPVGGGGGGGRRRWRRSPRPSTIRRAWLRPASDAFLPDLAMSLNNHAVQLGAVGRREEALEAIAEAVTIRRAWLRPGRMLSLPDPAWTA